MKDYTNHDSETIDRTFDFITRDEDDIRRDFFSTLSDEEWELLQKENREEDSL